MNLEVDMRDAWYLREHKHVSIDDDKQSVAHVQQYDEDGEAPWSSLTSTATRTPTSSLTENDVETCFRDKKQLEIE